jgi:hypothetical protein
MEVYRDVPVVYKAKEYHATQKVSWVPRKSFALFHGDVPVARFNTVTKIWEECENNRGNAYAARKRLKYRKN